MEYWSSQLLLLNCLFFLQFCRFFLHKFWGSVVRCMYVYSCYVFLLDWPFYHYNMFFVSQYCTFCIFERCCHWKCYPNAQVMLVIPSTNNLLYCFLNQSFNGLCTTTFKTCCCKVIPPGRMTKSVLNVFALFLYWFCQVTLLSIQTSWLRLFQANLFS